MQFPKKSYSRIKQAPHYKVELKVNNDEGKGSGALQHKVWKTGRLQPRRNDDSEAYEHQQTKFWDPGR